MTTPLVSILWLNYNSAPFIGTPLESLERIRDLEYPNFELIVVDNGSTDKSFKTIEAALEKMDLQLKIIKLKRNLGFTGGNNVAYRARNPNSKYIVLLNNDAFPYPDGLSNLVESMENDKALGSAQGVILNHDGKTIDTAGGFDDELLSSYLFLRGREPKTLRREICISHANGAYAIYRVEAVEKVMGDNERILEDELFYTREDDLIGFRLWNAGFKVKAFPFIVGKHKRSSSSRRVGVNGMYMLFRNWSLLNEISNSRYRNLVRLLIMRCGFTSFTSLRVRRKGRINSEVSPSVFLRDFQKAVSNGREIGKKIKTRMGPIDIYKAPIIKVRPSVALPRLVIPQRFVNRDISKVLDKILSGEIELDQLIPFDIG